MTHTCYLGDSKTLTIPLTWADAPFTPGGDWAGIFTAKFKSTDADIDAAFQHASGGNLSFSGSNAILQLDPADTDSLSPMSLICDVQVQHVTTGAIRTVALDRLKLIQDITREATTSVPPNNTATPMPFGGVTAANLASVVNAATADTAPLDADLLPMTETAAGGALRKLTFGNLWLWIKAKIDLGQTWAGNHICGGTLAVTGQVTSAGSTSTASGNNILNMATNDARYGSKVEQVLSANVESFTETVVNGPNLVVPTGSYTYEIFLIVYTLSETAGASGSLAVNPAHVNNDTQHVGSYSTLATPLNGNGGTTTSIQSVRVGASTFQFASAGNADAPGNYTSTHARGSVVFSSDTTVYFTSSNRTSGAYGAVAAMVNGTSYKIRSVGTTDFTLVGAANNNVGTVFTKSGSAATGTGTVYDQTNPSILAAGSYIRFIKL